MTAASQLPLGFEHRPALSGEDFLVASCNRDAVAWLDRWPDWPTPALVIHGPAGCGKTHLAEVFLEASGARPVSAEDLRREELPPSLDGARACVVEDAGKLLGGGLEEALLHLYNALSESGRHMLLTAPQPPARWPVELPDLRSRLKASAAVAIGLPDDALIAAVMVKLFADRQLRIDPEVVSYAVARVERSFDALRHLVAAVDAAALAARRNITVPLVRQVLEDLQRQDA